MFRSRGSDSVARTFIACLLTFLMVFSAFPSPAIAEILEDEPEVETVVEKPVEDTQEEGKDVEEDASSSEAVVPLAEEAPEDVDAVYTSMNSAASSDIIASGTWGTCPWEITEDGVLTVHPGKGAHESDESPWAEFADNITSIVFAKEGNNKILAPEDLSNLFKDLSRVTSIDCSNLITSSTTDMSSMFYGCSSLVSLDLSELRFSSSVSMSHMFYGCTSLASLSLSTEDEWGMGSSHNTEYMFYGCSSLASLDFSNLSTSNTGFMFYDCSSLSSLDVSSWNVVQVKDAGYMFYGCSSLASLDLSAWNTLGMEYTGYMFAECSSLAEILVSDYWSTENIGSASNMFSGCTSLVGGNGTVYDANHTDAEYARVDTANAPGYLTYTENCRIVEHGIWGTCPWELRENGVLTVHPGIAPEYGQGVPWNAFVGSSFSGEFDTLVFAEENGEKVVAPSNSERLLSNLYRVTYIDVSGLDVSQVTNMANMFSYCTSLTSINLSGWDTSHAMNMSGMFTGCFNLASLDLSGWDTSRVTSLKGMFSECYELSSLDLFGWDTSQVTNMSAMFSYCSSLSKIVVSSIWSTENVVQSNSMFYGCSALVGGNGTAFNSSYTDARYARIDADGVPGYLSERELIDISSNCFIGGYSGGPFAYDGNRHEPTNVSINSFMDGSPLELNVDYVFGGFRDSNGTPFDGDPIEVGEYQAVYKGIGSYCGEITLSFSIVARNDLTVAAFDLRKAAYYSTGSPVQLSVVITDPDGRVLKEGFDYEFEYYNASSELLESTPIAAGEYSVRAISVDGGDYTGETGLYWFEIRDPNDLALGTLTLGSWEYLATGSPVKLDVTLMDVVGKVLSEGVDYELKYYKFNEEEGGSAEELGGPPSEPGQYYICAVPAANSSYTGQNGNTWFTIYAANDLEAATVNIDPYNNVFTGSPIELGLTVIAADGNVLSEGDYIIKWFDDNWNPLDGAPTDIGSYSVTVEAVEGSGYFGTSEHCYFNIYDPYDLSSCWGIYDEFRFVCDGEAHAPDVTIRNREGSLLEYGVDYVFLGYRTEAGATSQSAPVEAGTYYSVYKGIGSYHGELECMFRIDDPNDLARFHVVTNYYHAFTGSPVELGETVTAPDGTVLTRGVDYELVYEGHPGSAPSELGYYNVRAEAIAGGSYTGVTNWSGVYIVAANDLRLASVDIRRCYAHTGSPVDLDETVMMPDGTVLTEGDDYTLVYRDNLSQKRLDGAPTEVGSYTVEVVATAGGSYVSMSEHHWFRIVEENNLGLATASVEHMQMVYTGSTADPGMVVTAPDGTVLEEGTHYSLDWFLGYSDVALDEPPVGVGHYYVRALAVDSSGFTGYTEGFEVEVVPRNISDAAISEIADQAWTGSEIKPSLGLTFNDLALSEGKDYVVSYDNNIGIGTATVTIEGRGCWTGTRTASFQIVARDISGVDIAEIANQTWTGSAITPPASVSADGTALVEGTDYDVSYTNNVGVGTATVTLTGKGFWTGTKTSSFQIVARSISEASIGEIGDQAYTGSAIEPKPTITYNGTTLVEDTDYEVSYSNNVGVGTASITITGINGYAGTTTATFSIVTRSISEADIAAISDQAWTGAAITPSVTVTCNGLKLNAGNDYIVFYSNNMDVGTATATIMGIGNYKDTKVTTFEIVPKGISGVSVAAVADQIWTGSAITPSLTVTYNGATLSEGTDYEVAYSDNVGVGTATATITGKGSWNGTKTVTFSIVARNIANATVSEIDAQAFTGSAIEPKPTVTYDGTALVEGTDYTVSYSGNIDAGTATVTITGIGGYAGTKSATFEISAASITGLVPESLSVSFVPGNDPEAVLDLTFAGKKLVENVDYAVSYGEIDLSGEVPVRTATVTGAGSFSGSIDVPLFIQPYAAQESDIAIAAIPNQAWSGSAIEPDVAVTVCGQALSKGADYEVSYTGNIERGEATAKVTLKGLYSGTASASFQIVPRSIADASISEIDAQVYTGSAVEPKLSVAYNGTALVEGTDYTVIYSNNTNAGTATATVTGINNFTGTTSATFSISSAQISRATIVPIADQTYTGSVVRPAVTVKDGNATLEEGVDYALSYKDNIDAGTATVTVRGIGNYAGTTTSTFAITPRTVTLTSSDASKVYDGTPLTSSTVIVGGDGFASGDGAIYNVTGTQTEAGSTKNSFTYALAAGTNPANYSITAVEGTLTVTPVDSKVTVAITGHSGSATYDGTEHQVVGYDVTSISNDLYKASDFRFSGTATASGTDAGSYAMGLKPSDFTNNNANFSNVEFVIVDGTLEIAKRPVTLKSASLSREYNGAALVNGSTPLEIETGWADGEGATYAFTRSQTTPGSTQNHFTYSLNDGTKAENYDISISYGTLTVTARDAKYTIELVANSSLGNVYDGATHSVFGVENDKFTFDGVEYTVSGFVTSNPSEKNAGTYQNVISAENGFKVTDPSGNDMSEQFSVTTKNGTLEIVKAAASFTGETSTQMYTGEEIELTNVAATGVVSGQTHNVTYSAKGTNVGYYDGTITAAASVKITDANGADVTANYTITTAPGRLTITRTDERLTVELASTEFMYDGASHNLGLPANTNAVSGDTAIEYSANGETWTTDLSALTATNVSDSCTIRVRATNPNYKNTATTEAKLSIIPRNVTLTSSSGTKPYDGAPLVKNAQTDILVGGDGFAGGEGATYTITGTQTEVGSSLNTFTAQVNEGTLLENYVLQLTFGTLKVTRASTEVTITAPSSEKVYDGTALMNDAVTITGLPEGFSYEVTVTGSQTDVGSCSNTVTAYKFFDAAGLDQTASFTNVTTVNGTLEVTARPVTITTGSATKAYDGTPLTESTATIEGLVSGESVTLRATGSQTEVGDSKNSYSIAWSNANSSNYTVTENVGTLEVTKNDAAVTITAASGSKVYDGTPLTASTVTASGLPEGFTVVATASGTITNAGTTVNAVDPGFVIKNASGADKTANFTNVTVVNGTLEVTKRQVTLKSATLSRAYNGAALVNGSTPLEIETGWADGEGATYTFTRSQTVPGSTQNHFNYTLNEGTLAGNYDISVSYGTLTVTNRDAQYEITVIARSAYATYDGQEHSATGFESLLFEVEGNTYSVSGLTAESPAMVNAGTYSNNVTGTPVVKDAEGNDVSDLFAVHTENGQLVIAKKAVTLTSATATKAYDGTPLMSETVSGIDGFVGTEGVILSGFASQTEVGSTDNTFTYTFKDNTVAGNYDVTVAYGTLTVTSVSSKVTVTITENSGSATYDGKEHVVSGYTVTGISDPLYKASDVAFTGDATVRGTDAGTYEMQLKASDFANTNTNFSDVEFVIVDGTLTINKRSVTLRSESASRAYDGTPLTAPAVTIGGDGFVSGEATAAATGAITEAGSVANAIVVSEGEGFKAGNYTITKDEGTLTISPVNSKVTVTIAEKSSTATYDGEEHAVSGYEVSDISNPLYKETDFTFSGTAEAKGTDAGTYEMQLEASDFANANPNFSSVEFVIVDGELAITPRKVTLTSASDTKPYDGTPLTDGEVAASGDGWAEGEGATYEVTGTVTEVGSAENAFTFTLNEGTKAENYEIETVFGTLEVTSSAPFFLDADPADDANHGAEVDWMGRSGISTGWEVTGGREYRGMRNVARCDFAAFLYRMADLADNGARDDSIALTGAEVESVLAGVSDCTPATPHAAEVAWLIDSGISRGWQNEDGSVAFRPYANVARQDMAAFLYRFADLQDNGVQDGSPAMGPQTVTFSDVRHGDTTNHAAEVEWLASVGVTKGWDMGNGTYQFRGTNNVARQDMAAFMYRLYTYLQG